MKIDLSGKTALVTGSTEGIGFAIAKGLAEAGAEVVVNGRTEEKVAATVARIGAGVRGCAVDLSTAEGANALIAAEPAFDIVVSNLGIYQRGDFFEVDDDVWERHWQVNVMAGVRLARAYLPKMEKKGWGRFLFLSSESAYNIPANMIHYGVSKTADVSLARGLAKRMAGTGVTVNTILPGPTMTENMAKFAKQNAAASGKSLDEAAIDFVKSIRPSTIIGRPATVDEVASMAVYIASPQASATTGAALRCDGGVVDFIM
jgi:NAD(P)-dependent dehydrogenase (short-subunit alcohol dehydrogenase family)